MITPRPEEFEGRVDESRDWRSIIQMVSDLPPLSAVATQALKILEDPKATPDQITKVIGQDTSLTARVLKIANSAMFARQAKITTLSQGVVLIGFKTLKGLVMAAAVRGVVGTDSAIDKLIWKNSVCTGFLASEIAKCLKLPYHEESFTQGLLHDMGKIVLISQMRAEYAKVVNSVCRGHSFVEAEQAHLGFTHALIGALVAKKWNFSPDTCQVILHHHDPLETPYSQTEIQKTAIVQAADLLAYFCGAGGPDGYPDCTEDAMRALQWLGIEGVDKFCARCKDLWESQSQGEGMQ